MSSTTHPSLPELLRARYGEAAPKILDHLNETFQSALSHRSVRAYLPDPLEPGTLEWLVATAQSAATSSNLQAWSVVAVQEKEHKARLAHLARDQQQIIEAPLFLVWIADLSRLRRVATQVGSTADGLDYLESLLIGVIDAALAAQNAVIAAESIGLGTVYIGAIRNNPEEVARELRLPPEAFPVFGLVVGKPDPARPTAVKPRLPQSAVLHHEHYQAEADQKAVTEYDSIIGKFYQSQNLPQQAWTTHTATRIASAQPLGNRAKIATVLRNLGFKNQ